MSKLTYKELDGLERDVAKLRYEAGQLDDEMPADTIPRLKKEPWNTHHQTNFMVEAARVRPYLMGHVQILTLYALLIETIALVAVILW